MGRKDPVKTGSGCVKVPSFLNASLRTEQVHQSVKLESHSVPWFMTFKLLTTAVVFKEGAWPLGGKPEGSRRAAE